MVVIFSVVSVVSLTELGLLAKPVVSLIVRSLCLPFNFAWFRQAHLLICILGDCRFAGVSSLSFPLDARDPVDNVISGVFLILAFRSLSSRFSSTSISCCSMGLCDFSSNFSSHFSEESPPFTTSSSWCTNATFATPV